MASLIITCYGQVCSDGRIPVADYFLGKESITLATSSDSATLPVGTRYVRLATDATEAVYFTFGSDDATTDGDELRADLGEYTRYIGVSNESEIHAILAT